MAHSYEAEIYGFGDELRTLSEDSLEAVYLELEKLGASGAAITFKPTHTVWTWSPLRVREQARLIEAANQIGTLAEVKL